MTAKGVLSHEGKPLPYYQVTFLPDDKKRPASGTTDEQGHFTLGTNGAGDGAVAGKGKVTIVFVGPPNQLSPDMDGYKPPKPPVKLPAKYSSELATDLTLEVPAGGSSELKVELK